MKQTFILILLFTAIISRAQNGSSKTGNPNDNRIKVEEMPLDEPTPPEVHVMPEFPGGEQAMMDFISKNLVYPDSAKKYGVEGKIRVKFTVTSLGEIKDVHVIGMQKLGYGLEEEAVRVIKKMPRWKAGTINNVPVRVYFNIPIRFKLF